MATRTRRRSVRSPERCTDVSFLTRSRPGYSHALSFDPPASAAAALLGSRADCRRQQGQLKAALADADAVLVLEPTPAALLQRALLLEATERYDAAAEAFAAALAASGTAEALAGVRRMRGMR